MNKENYKKRIVYEMLDLEDKIEKINNQLAFHEQEMDKKEVELLNQQVSSMYSYRDLLINRLFLYLGD